MSLGSEDVGGGARPSRQHFQYSASLGASSGSGSTSGGISSAGREQPTRWHVPKYCA